jgi:predicted S18 family serine protease
MGIIKMQKIFFSFILTFFIAIPSFAQTNMMMQANKILLMAAMEDDQQQQAQAPIVVNIQYQSDGTAVVTSSVPVQVQTASPPTEDSNFGEIFLSLFLGLFVGWILKGMFSRTK